MFKKHFQRFVMTTIALATTWATAAQLDAKSAHRDPSVSYKQYVNRARTLSARPIAGGSALDNAVKFRGAQLPAATEWGTERYAQANFVRLRDERFLVDSQHPGFMRRSTWLYPDDGCFARAQLANNNLLNWNVETPKKVFVFGDLNVRTANSPTGSVSWWYHVAPIVEVRGQKFVLDPALNAAGPLRLDQWLALQSTTPGELEVAICASGSYSPYDACDREIRGNESEAVRDQQGYLGSEWSRVQSLGRDPNQELGDNPPW